MAKTKTPPAIEVVAIEVVPDSEPGLQIVTSEEAVIAKAAELKTRYLGFTAASITSAEIAENASKDLRELVRIRNRIDERRKAINRQVNAEGERLAGLFAETEATLKAAVDEYKATEAKKAEEARKARAAEIENRKNQLFATGAVWGGSMFQLGFVMKTMAEIEDNAAWPDVLQEFIAEAERLALEAKKEREDRKAREAENARIAEENAKIARENEELRAKLAAAEAQEQQRAAAAENERKLLAERKLILVEQFGAEFRMEINAEPVESGGIYGVRLGRCWVTRSNILEDWPAVLKAFEAEFAAIEAAKKGLGSNSDQAPPAVEQAPLAVEQTPSAQHTAPPAAETAPPKQEQTAPAPQEPAPFTEPELPQFGYVEAVHLSDDQLIRHAWLCGARDALARAKAEPGKEPKQVFADMKKLAGFR